MHRQSLGSPSSKLHGVADEISPIADEPPKTHRLSLPPSTTPHKFIHLIPILTLICFFILYLFSHTPSQSDMDHFSGFNRSPKHRLDSVEEISNIERYMLDAKRVDALGIRSLRNLQQIPKSRLHRKLAEF